MPVVNTKSTNISRGDTVGSTNNGYLYKGELFKALGLVSVAASDDDTSTYRVVRVPSNALVSKVQVVNSAITGGTSYDVGVYRTAADGGAVVSATAIASAVDMSSARAAWTDVSFEARAITDAEKRLWELLSLARDPQVEYDIVLRANTVGTAAGTIVVAVEYTV